MKKQLPVVQLQDKIKVVMPDEVLHKVKFLCKQIMKDEWSGMLFYSIEGTVKEPSKMIITLQDILPMDKGSAAFTSYDIDRRYEDYLLEEGQEHRMEWHVGHIHSHNVMNVFFSGTDMDELDDNSEAHNFYLSLIVNNWMDFCAKVAFRGIAETITNEIPYYAMDEDGEKYIIDKKEFTIKKEKLFVYDCDIVSQAEQVIVESDFASKVAEIMKPKPAPKTKAVTSYKGVVHNRRNNVPNNGKKVGGKNNVVTKFFQQHPAPDVHPNIVEDHTGEEIFALTLLNFSNPLGAGDDMDSLMSDIEEFQITPEALAASIIGNYATIFEAHFPFYDDQGIMFCDTTEKVIEFFIEQETIYPILSATIDQLKQMLTKFEEYGTTTRA